MNELRKKIAAFLEENREAMIADIQAFARIRSVSQAAKAEENAPFGPECRQMLDFALAHAKEMGFDGVVPVSGQTYSPRITRATWVPPFWATPITPSASWAIWTWCPKATSGSILPTVPPEWEISSLAAAFRTTNPR